MEQVRDESLDCCTSGSTPICLSPAPCNRPILNAPVRRAVIPRVGPGILTSRSESTKRLHTVTPCLMLPVASPLVVVASATRPRRQCIELCMENTVVCVSGVTTAMGQKQTPVTPKRKRQIIGSQRAERAGCRGSCQRKKGPRQDMLRRWFCLVLVCVGDSKGVERGRPGNCLGKCHYEKHDIHDARPAAPMPVV